MSRFKRMKSIPCRAMITYCMSERALVIFSLISAGNGRGVSNKVEKFIVSVSYLRKGCNNTFIAANICHILTQYIKVTPKSRRRKIESANKIVIFFAIDNFPLQFVITLESH